MRPLAFACAASLCASAALPGGIDQSGQPVTLLFHDGDYAEVGLGYWMPTIRADGEPGQSTGNAYGDLPDFSGGIRLQLTERLAAALIATHNPDLAARMDRVLRLDAGRIVDAAR